MKDDLVLIFWCLFHSQAVDQDTDSKWVKAYSRKLLLKGENQLVKKENTTKNFQAINHF